MDLLSFHRLRYLFTSRGSWKSGDPLAGHAMTFSLDSESVVVSGPPVLALAQTDLSSGLPPYFHPHISTEDPLISTHIST